MIPNPAKAIYGTVADKLSEAWSLPRAAYLDPVLFELEEERLFHDGWLPVARLSDLPSAGSYMSVDLLGTLLLVTRDQAGAIHVVSRVCRHRAMPVAEGSGQAKGFVCPYHLWRYGLDGKFLTAPAMETSSAFNPSECDLPAIRHEVWGGWIFVNLSGTAQPLSPQLAGLAKRLEHLRPETMVTVGHLTFDSPWNWKVMVENFMESYHHLGPHAQSLQKSYPALGTYSVDGGDAYSILENPPVSNDGHSLVVACIFPMTLIAFTEGDVPTGVWYELQNVSVDRFTLRIHLMAPPEIAGSPEFLEIYREQVRQIHLEDVSACEGVWKGLQSRLYQPGPLSHLEASLWHFQKYLSARLA